MNRVELSFLSGLDAHAEVEFFLLCKALPNKVLSSKLWVTNGPQRG
jgi:hypothetical protein